MTVEVTNTEPFPSFPAVCAHPLVSVQPPNHTETGNIGTGPYKLEEEKSEQHVKVSAFEEYWGSEPKIEELTYRIIADRIHVHSHSQPMRLIMQLIYPLLSLLLSRMRRRLMQQLGQK